MRPATPTTAFPLGEKVDDPLAMYLFDLCTLPLNLAGHCGMSVPSGLSPDDGLPVGLQVLAGHHREQLLLDVALRAEHSMPWPLVAPGSPHATGRGA